MYGKAHTKTWHKGSRSSIFLFIRHLAEYASPTLWQSGSITSASRRNLCPKFISPGKKFFWWGKTQTSFYSCPSLAQAQRRSEVKFAAVGWVPYPSCPSHITGKPATLQPQCVHLSSVQTIKMCSTGMTRSSHLSIRKISRLQSLLQQSVVVDKMPLSWTSKSLNLVAGDSS